MILHRWPHFVARLSLRSHLFFWHSQVEPQKVSPLEIILLNSGVYSDYAAEWVKTHELTDNFRVDATTYRDFQSFVEKKQSEGDEILRTAGTGTL